MTTFQQFLDSKEFCDDLTHFTCADEITAGYVYADSFYIEEIHFDDIVTDGIRLPEYVVTIGNCEFNFAQDIEAAERFLWYEFAMLELNHDIFTACEFYFVTDPNFRGFAHGTTWNGFDNVSVTPEVHKQVCDHFIKELGYDADETGLTEIEQDQFGLYDYSNGFATAIDEDIWHIINR